MRKIVIFGGGELGEVALYYFTHDTPYQVVAFTLDSDYIEKDNFNNLPVVPFQEIEQHFPASEYDFFVALSYSKLNSLRQLKYTQAKLKGYKLASYISSRALVANNVVIGDNCFILELNNIQPFVKIGNNVTLWSGNHIGHHSEIADNCFLASHVVVSGGVKILENCFIGVNATLYDHITIAKNNVIGAGAIMSKSTEEDAIYRAQATLPKISIRN
jgi:sugar O-acyltransferase (sialic acid O-acetyltransferase NeuD family)